MKAYKEIVVMLLRIVAALIALAGRLLAGAWQDAHQHVELPGVLGKAARTWDRWKWRAGLSTLATAGAFALVEPLARVYGDVAPEIPRVLPALAVVYWVDVSLHLLRTLLAPGADLQAMIDRACDTAEGAASMARMQTYTNVAKLGMVLCIVYAPV